MDFRVWGHETNQNCFITSHLNPSPRACLSPTQYSRQSLRNVTASRNRCSLRGGARMARSQDPTPSPFTEQQGSVSPPTNGKTGGARRVWNSAVSSPGLELGEPWILPEPQSSQGPGTSLLASCVPSIDDDTCPVPGRLAAQGRRMLQSENTVYQGDENALELDSGDGCITL